MRSYSELKNIEGFLERYEYLKLQGSVGIETFGFDRYLNQAFYGSKEWQEVRTHVIARDLGRDLGVEGWDIHHNILVHHMNPITDLDLIHRNIHILDPDNLITTSHKTHNAIHFGSDHLLLKDYELRKPGDTVLW